MASAAFFTTLRANFYIVVGTSILNFLWGLVFAGYSYYQPDAPFIFGFGWTVWLGIVLSLLGAAMAITGYRVLAPHVPDE